MAAAIERYFEESGRRLPVMASGTIVDLSGRTMIAQTIEAFADPVGSFRSRRVEGAFVVSLVSYLGGSGGWESVAAGSSDNSTYGGAFAPVGFEVSYGIGHKIFSSIGLLVSFADLGTLVSYRFDGDALAPVVTWGINPGQSSPVDGRLPRLADTPDAERASVDWNIRFLSQKRRFEGAAPRSGPDTQRFGPSFGEQVAQRARVGNHG